MMMKPNMALLLQALFCMALLCACPALIRAQTPKTGTDAAGAAGIGESKPAVSHGFTWGVNGDGNHATISKGVSWQYKGSHGTVGWSGGVQKSCKLGCCAPFAGHCKHCCISVHEAQAFLAHMKNHQAQQLQP
ncbi:unnamed protein product [Cuscuta campestris]|uniref:C2H2-type domain-containing protein n=2 Tax=Cuscuta sect. Cleistogrammica TaxID=1824901 RepID=A0A484LDD6_9ASTE|nr:hypothetical protein DM860_009604 [Cuscuta australis]VFQ74393.1 unnamed protein product [Cuscuta campestris]